MARVNVYLPDDLASQARKARLNISTLTQRAVRDELGVRATSSWLARLETLSPLTVNHDEVLRAIQGARDEAEEHVLGRSRP